MRIYDDYKCSDDDCEGKMKDVQRPPCDQADGLPPCPICGKPLVIDWSTKLGGFSLKGRGWFGNGKHGKGA